MNAHCSYAELTGSAETAGGQNERGAQPARPEGARPLRAADAGRTNKTTHPGTTKVLYSGMAPGPDTLLPEGEPLREDLGRMQTALGTTQVLHSEIASALLYQGQAPVVWIADSGSANHLCADDTLPGGIGGMRPCPDVRLATANGIIEPRCQLEVYLTDLGVDARFLVRKDRPPVLSIGRLAEQHGFQFHWAEGSAHFIPANGTRQTCRIKNFAPHVNTSTTSPWSTSAVASATPAPLQNHAMPSLAIANEAHRDDGGEEEGRPGQPLDATDDSQNAERVEEKEALTREARLRLEAKSTSQLLTHIPMNSYCDVCQAAKLRQKPARRRRGDVELNGRPQEWCHTLLADHVSTGDMGLSIDDDKYGLVMLDVGTDICDILAAKSKSTQCTLVATKEFGGVTTWQYFGSDNAKELNSASAASNMVHLSAMPYRPESNGIIERRIGVISDGIRCFLNQSGLPHGWWPYAGRAFSHALNIRQDSDGMSPWHRRCGQPWPDKDSFAFGQQVHYRKPLPFKDGKKFAPRGSKGVFVGWFLLPGGIYKGDLLVIDLDELAEAPASMRPKSIA